MAGRGRLLGSVKKFEPALLQQNMKINAILSVSGESITADVLTATLCTGWWILHHQHRRMDLLDEVPQLHLLLVQPPSQGVNSATSDPTP